MIVDVLSWNKSSTEAEIAMEEARCYRLCRAGKEGITE